MSEILPGDLWYRERSGWAMIISVEDEPNNTYSHMCFWNLKTGKVTVIPGSGIIGDIVYRDGEVFFNGAEETRKLLEASRSMDTFRNWRY